MEQRDGEGEYWKPLPMNLRGEQDKEGQGNREKHFNRETRETHERGHGSEGKVSG